jgi:hypothetical protein
MSPVSVRRRPGPASTPRTARAPVGIAVVGALMVLALAVLLSREPQRLRLSVVNSTPYVLSIDVRGSDGEGWFPVGYVEKRVTTDIEEILDQGQTWIFRIGGQGRDAGTFTMTRVQLAEAGWRFEVPSEVEATLHAAGAPPSP